MRPKIPFTDTEDKFKEFLLQLWLSGCKLPASGPVCGAVFLCAAL